jgi:hypothetical protein
MTRAEALRAKAAECDKKADEAKDANAYSEKQPPTGSAWRSKQSDSDGSDPRPPQLAASFISSWLTKR